MGPKIGSGEKFKYTQKLQDGTVVGSNEKFKIKTDQTGQVSLYGNNTNVRLAPESATQLAIFGNGNRIIDGAETQGRKSDTITINGDSNTYTAADSTTGNYGKGGDDITIIGDKNRVDLKTGNKVTIRDKEGIFTRDVSKHNSVFAQSGGRMNDYTGHTLSGNKTNTITVQKDPNATGWAPRTEVKASSRSVPKVKVEKGASVALERPNYANGFNGAYKVEIHDGKGGAEEKVVTQQTRIDN